MTEGQWASGRRRQRWGAAVRSGERGAAEDSRLTRDAKVNQGPPREEDGRCRRAGRPANSPVTDLREGD